MDYVKIKQDILLKAHKQYVDWWLPIDVAGGSFLAPMSLERFCSFMLKMPDEEYFDRWIDETELPIPKDGDIRLARIYMKDFILKTIGMHMLEYINLHDKGNEFTNIKEDGNGTDELR